MAAQFCMKCGKPIPEGAQFCQGCGSPVAAAAGSPAPPPPPPPPPSGVPSAAPTGDLSGALGLRGQKNFLVQHQVISLGHSYRVMDAHKHHLFTVRGDAGQNLQGNLLAGALGGGYLGRLAGRSVNMTYSLVTEGETVHGQVLKEGGGNQSTFTLTDPAGQRWLVVHLQRGVMGGITATAVNPAGQPMMQTSGNLLRHNFVIKDPSGKELAKVHEAWVAVRDTYNVDLMGEIDPMYPLVFTILIDFEKEK